MFWSQMPTYVQCPQADTQPAHLQVYHQKIAAFLFILLIRDLMFSEKTVHDLVCLSLFLPPLNPSSTDFVFPLRDAARERTANTSTRPPTWRPSWRSTGETTWSSRRQRPPCWPNRCSSWSPAPPCNLWLVLALLMWELPGNGRVTHYENRLELCTATLKKSLALFLLKHLCISSYISLGEFIILQYHKFDVCVSLTCFHLPGLRGKMMQRH